MTLANVTISSGNVTITNVSVTTANVTTLNATTVIATTANVTTANITTGNVTNMTSGNVTITGGSINGTTLGATTASTANVTTLTTSSTVTINGGTANGVAYLNGSKVLTTGSALTFDGTDLATTGSFSTGDAQNISLNASSSGRTNRLQWKYQGTAYAWIERVNSNGDMAFGVQSSEAMRLTSTSLYTASGINLGIGTSSPWTKLSVYGSGDQRIAVTSPTGGSTIAAIDLSPSLTAGEAAANAPQARIYAVDSNYSANIIFASKVTGATANALQTRMTLDSSGNLGLGVTPSAWGGSFKAFQIASGGTSLWSDGSVAFYNRNTFYDGTNRKYVVDGFAQEYAQLNDGSHAWKITTSGSANGNISFTQAMTLDASGNLGVGATSITGVSGYQIIETRGSIGGIYQTSASGNSVRARFYSTSDGGFAGTPTNHPFAFITNDTERARITSGGYSKFSNDGTYAGSTGSYHEFVNSASDDVIRVRNKASSSPLGIDNSFSAAAPNNTANYFFQCRDTGGERATIRSNGGLANYQGNDVNLSDRREKTNFAPAKSYLDTICAIPVQTFNYIDQSENDPGLTLGVVAQDVQAVAPELVMESDWSAEKDGSKMRLSIYQTDLQYALMKCIQELKAQNDDLRARVAQLENLKGN
jgi:hypothetical protein